MRSMFQGASSFNQSLQEWNVSSVTNMRFMFYRASAFNQPLGQWNVESVIQPASRPMECRECDYYAGYVLLCIFFQPTTRAVECR